MAYPFVQMPTLDQFGSEVEGNFEVEVKAVSISPPQRYFLRVVSRGKEIAFPPPSLHGRDRLTPTQLRSLCAQLEIPVTHFGFVFK